MKIVIQGHPTRGKEVVEILKSFGGKSIFAGLGFNERYYYYINSNNIIRESLITIKTKEEFKLYTLEEFEKEFPFKVGDKVVWDKDNYTTVRTVLRIDYSDLAGIKYAITAFGEANCFWEVDANELKSYKEMKEERNITLTLDKAKEWYKKGGELKEVALQAFSEQELNPLPRSWEEYNEKYGGVCLSTRYTNTSLKNYDAIIKLGQLRDCWRKGWIPDYTKTYKKFRIKKLGTEYIVDWSTGLSDFLVFQTEELAKEFLKCFRDLIEKAGDLI